MNSDRRRWALGAAVAAAAAGAGAGWALWRQRGAAPAAQDALWSSSFDTPAGQRLVMADLRGHKLVLNFWAPWCPPCVREMPVLDRFHATFAAQGGQVLGVALDQPEAVKSFLLRVPVAFPIVLAGPQGPALVRELGNQAGGLPFSVLFDREGRLTQRHLGEMHEDRLLAWVESLR